MENIENVMDNHTMIKKSYSMVLSPNRIIVLLFCSVCMFIFWLSDGNNNVCTYVMSWMANLFLLLRLKDCKRVEGKIFNQYTLFIIISFLYIFGQTLLFSLGIVRIEGLVNGYNINLINKYLLFAVPSFYIFTIPINLLKKQRKPENIVNEEDNATKKSVMIVCGLLLIISAPFYWMEVIDFIRIALISGYAANYVEDGEAMGILANVILLYVPAVAFLIVNTRKKIAKYLLLVMLIVPAFGYMFVGGRGKAMSLLTCGLFLWMTEICKTKKKGKYLLAITLVGVLLLGLFSTLREIRDFSLGTPSEIIAVFISNNLLEGVISTIKEIGSTIYTWIRVEQIVPSLVGFRFGYSYLAAILSCIPSGLIGYSFADDAALDIWLTNEVNADYGLGFSMMAESYCNFGYVGIILIFFVGLFMFYFLSGNIIRNGDIRFKNAVSAIALYIFTNIARNSLSLSVRNIFYGIIIPLLLIKVLRMIMVGGKK